MKSEIGESMNKESGFTLIELMIVVAIIGLLAAIGYPSYQRHVWKSGRSDAHTSLLRMADMQERFYLQNNTYSNDVAQLGGSVSQEGYYNLSVSGVTNNTYTLTATAVAGSTQANDADCASLTLNQAGQRGSAPSPATVCW